MKEERKEMEQKREKEKREENVAHTQAAMDVGVRVFFCKDQKTRN